MIWIGEFQNAQSIGCDLIRIENKIDIIIFEVPVFLSDHPIDQIFIARIIVILFPCRADLVDNRVTQILLIAFRQQIGQGQPFASGGIIDKAFYLGIGMSSSSLIIITCLLYTSRCV